MALAFIAFFGVITTAVLGFADTVELQQRSTLKTADQHAAAEGGALFAAADAIQRSTTSPGPYPAGSCVAGSTSVLTMTDGAQVTYTTNRCNPGHTADLIANQCSVCVLDSGSEIRGSLAAQGPIAFNSSPDLGRGGSVASTVRLASSQSNPGFIGCYGGCSNGTFAPAAAPLDQRVTAPSLSGWTPPNPTFPCKPVDDDNYPPAPSPPNPPNTYILGSGTYCSITWQPQSPDATLHIAANSVLILEGPFDIGQGASVVADGPVLLDLAPGYYGQRGGSLSIGPEGNLSLDHGPVGGAGDIVIFADPGDLSGGPLINVDGGQLSVAGTVYAPQAGLALSDSGGGQGRSGGGSLTISPRPSSSFASGDLIVSSISVDTSSQVSVTAAPPNGGYCWVYDDSARVTEAAETVQSHIIVATECSSGGSGIVDVTYGQ